MIIDEGRTFVLPDGSELQAGYADERLLPVPGRRDVLEGDFEAPAFTRGKRRSPGSYCRALLAQGDLVQVVEEFDRYFCAAKSAIAGVDELAGKRSDFLMQEIFGSAKSDRFEMNPRSVGLLLGPEREMQDLGCGTRRRLTSRPSEKRNQNDQHRRDGQHQGKGEAATVRLRSIGNLDLGLFVQEVTATSMHATRYEGELARYSRDISAAHDEPLDQRLRQPRGTHASLHFRNIIRNAPEFNDPVFQVRDRKAGARIAVTRLADRAWVQQIAALVFDAKRRERFGRSRMKAENFQMRIEILVGKPTLVMCVTKESDAPRGIQQALQSLGRREDVFVFILKRTVNENDVVGFQGS